MVLFKNVQRILTDLEGITTYHKAVAFLWVEKVDPAIHHFGVHDDVTLVGTTLGVSSQMTSSGDGL